MKTLLRMGLCVVFLWTCFSGAGADAAEMNVGGSIKASFGGTQYLDFVDGARGSDSDFDATRELGIKFEFVANEYLKGVLSFQIGEGSTGGYFGSTDALVGGEEDGDLILELDNLYIDFVVPGTRVNFKVGSQGAVFADAIYGSQLMYEVPAGVSVKIPFAKTGAVNASWFRMTDLMEDTPEDLDDQADLFYAEVPLSLNNFSLTPYAAYATIGETVVQDGGANYWRYSYFDYPGLLQGAFGDSLAAVMPTDNVDAFYGGIRLGLDFDRLKIQSTATYGDMNWDSFAREVNIAGFFADLVVEYKTKYLTPELFGFYGNGPDANDEDLDFMPPLIGGPTYTSSFFGGSRFNDNMFDSHDTTYASGMWAVGFKLKDIKIGDRLTNEFQVMYAEGTAEDTLFQAPDDILLNEDESFLEFNFNSEYEIMKGLLAATEFGYIVFDEDSDYNDPDRSVENFWKAALALEYYF
jgi:hypothetical protein